MTEKFVPGPSQTPVSSLESSRHRDSSQIASSPSSAFSKLNREVASSRRRATRVLARQRLRRRVVPPLMVGSTVLLGGGLSAAWVNGTLRATPATATREVMPSAAWAKASAKAQAVELQALDHVRRALAADSQMISSLSRAAGQALVTNSKTTVIHESESITGTNSILGIGRFFPREATCRAAEEVRAQVQRAAPGPARQGFRRESGRPPCRLSRRCRRCPRSTSRLLKARQGHLMSSSEPQMMMLGSQSVPASQAPASLAPNEHRAQVRAMATEVTIRVPDAADNVITTDATKSALDVFKTVETSCTRFDPASPLMKANRSPNRWHRLPRECFKAIVAAHSAYERTNGVFDPRILEDLVGLGYDRTLPFADGEVSTRGSTRRRAPLGQWRPRFRGATNEVLIGDHPIDLGGIGKGLAVGWASERLYPVAPNHLIEAGGDCYCAGVSGEGTPWRIGIENPEDSATQVAVLELRDLACTTSSVRVRRWKAAGRTVHHILDATTGRPGGDGLLSVTVIGKDPAISEVWSKTLFLAGATGIAAVAKRRQLAAVWVTTAGELGVAPAAARHVIWER